MRKVFNKIWNLLYMVFVYMTFLSALISAVLLIISVVCYPIEKKVEYAFLMMCFTFVYTLLKGSD